jgi:hypothetical protein
LHRKAVHANAALPLWSLPATIALSLELAGLAVKGLVPNRVSDDIAFLATVDSENASTDDGDDSSKPLPESDSATVDLPAFHPTRLFLNCSTHPHLFSPPEGTQQPRSSGLKL